MTAFEIAIKYLYEQALKAHGIEAEVKVESKTQTKRRLCH